VPPDLRKHHVLSHNHMHCSFWWISAATMPKSNERPVQAEVAMEAFGRPSGKVRSPCHNMCAGRCNSGQ
jgi:hypothetical protein